MTCTDAQAIWGLQLTQPKREVLRAYLDRANAEGVSNPTIREIAWMTDYHERHAQRLTRALEADGILIARPVPGKPTEYRFDLSKAAVKPAFGEGVTIVTPDIQIAPHEMSPLTSDSTPDIPTGDIQIAPLASHTSAGKSFKTQEQRQEQEQVLKDKSTTTTTTNASEQARVFRLYEQNIGVLAPLIADAIKDAIRTYTAAWVADAIEVAVEHNVRKWAYIASILERWIVDGKNSPRPNTVKGAHPARAAPNGNGKHAPPVQAGNDGIFGLKQAQAAKQEAK